MSAPPNVTELGAIAYRLDAIASELSEIARVHDYLGVQDLANRLWGAMDDLITYGREHPT
jgi:hypothetical protein